jgi:transposase InsO family protein
LRFGLCSGLVAHYSPPMIHVGIGYDVHRLVSGRKLVLGGVDIPYDLGLEGHSDADVGLHALTDALRATILRLLGYRVDVIEFVDSANTLSALKSIRRARPDDAPIYIILDNLSAHTGPTIRAWAKKNRVELCFTPTYASWANPIEAHFGPLRQFTTWMLA